MSSHYKPLAERIQSTHAVKPLFCSSFIQSPNLSTDPSDEVFLSGLSAHCIGESQGAALNLIMEQAHISYLDSLGIRGLSSELNFQFQNISRAYPLASPEAALLHSTEDVKSRIADILRERENFAYFPSFVTQDSVDVVETLQIPFGNIRAGFEPIAVSKMSHSKAFLRKGSSEHDYLISAGETIDCRRGNLEPKILLEKINTLIEKAKFQYKLNNSDVAKLVFWLKLDNLAGGDGVVKITSPFDETTCESAISKILNIVDRCENNDPNFANLLVLELGDDSIASNNVITNVNAQAIIGADGKITPMDVSMQHTSPNGIYLGNMLPLTNQESVGIIYDELQKIANYYYKNGYCGLLGGDALLLQVDTGFKVIWFDMNTRINGSQAFQEHFRLIKSIKPNIVALNKMYDFHQGVNHEILSSILGDLLFTGENLRGVIPSLYMSNESSLSPIVSTSIIGNNIDDLELITNQLKQKFKF